MENKRIEYAKKKNAQGYNCAQAIALAYQDLIPISPEILFKMVEGFGGGMGRMQETCGLLTGLYVILSYLTSDGDMENGKSKIHTYHYIKKLHDNFCKQTGSAHCFILLQGQAPSAKVCKSFSPDKYLVACEVFEDILKELHINFTQNPTFIDN